MLAMGADRRGHRIEKRVSVQAVNQAKASKGIITTYCDGHFPKCPTWVKQAAALEKK